MRVKLTLFESLLVLVANWYLFLAPLAVLFGVLSLLHLTPSLFESPQKPAVTIKLDANGDTLYWEGCIGGWSYTNPYETDSLEWR